MIHMCVWERQRQKIWKSDREGQKVERLRERDRDRNREIERETERERKGKAWVGIV